MSKNLNAEKALIFRITHIKNVQWILRNGLHCKNSNVLAPDFVPIGNLDLIQSRTARTIPVPPGGTLADYIPFYFTPYSMMMYNIKTGYGGIRHFPNAEIVIMVSSLRGLASRGLATVYSDRHAYLQAAQFFTSLDDLHNIDWGILQQRDFKRDLDDPEKTDRYQAEALVHRHLPMEHLIGIGCFSENEVRTLEQQRRQVGLDLSIVARPSWYF
jgi:ssDNA thymidine ADP-ribosyltransferase, DarT